MKPASLFLLLALLLLGCPRRQVAESPATSRSSPAPREITEPGWQAWLDSAGLRGCLVIFDQAANAYHSNDFAWARTGQLPASTYKIPHSLIALETGVVASERAVFPWDGQPRRIKSWEADLTLRQAFHRSCVPCYQQVARQVGVARMRAQLQRLGYPGMRLDSATLDQFWLQGPSRITPLQQIDFLRRLQAGQLPLTAHTDSVARRLFLIEATDAYRLSGKTGWSIVGAQHNGWFVGWLETAANVYVVATNLAPGPGYEMANFGEARQVLTRRALRDHGGLPAAITAHQE